MCAAQTEYRLIFSASITADTANTLKSRIVTIISQADFARLTIVFSSEGGFTEPALALFNFFNALPVRVHFHAAGHVGSSAAPAFLAGRTRSCEPFARFFFHEYDWTFVGGQTLRRIDEAAKRLRSDIDLARKIIQSRTQATTDILNALDGTAGPAILTPEQAKALGFVQEVKDLGHTTADGLPITVWTT
jgi:ATP-dependent protease ClpP protease subunit